MKSGSMGKDVWNSLNGMSGFGFKIFLLVSLLIVASALYAQQRFTILADELPMREVVD